MRFGILRLVCMRIKGKMLRRFIMPIISWSCCSETRIMGLLRITKYHTTSRSWRSWFSSFKPRLMKIAIYGVLIFMPFSNDSLEGSTLKDFLASRSLTLSISTRLMITPKSTPSRPGSNKTRNTTQSYSSVSPKSKPTLPPTKPSEKPKKNSDSKS